jgi:hypothetical protein
MNTKTIVTAILLLFVLASGVWLVLSPGEPTESRPARADFAKSLPGDGPGESIEGRRVIAYYFHGDVRCATCNKLEAYAGEAIQGGFEDELSSGELVWRTVNYDKPGNEHYIEDYSLPYQSVVLVEQIDGHEMAYRNLDQIWELVGDKEAYLEYVRTETRHFLDSL